MSRLAHRAFFLDDEEKTRAGEILRRINARYREASLSQVLGRWKRLGDEEADLEARTSDEEIRVALRRMPLVIPPADRDQEPDSLQPVLPRADAGEGACRPNRPRAPERAASGI